VRPQHWLVVVIAGAVIGLVFALISTYDFVQHLDRQIHSLHCSFIPGGSGEVGSGCHVAMMSPYSSLLRGTVWGGIPISLPAMSVFGFILFFAIDLLVTRRKTDPRATGFLALAAALPALTSIVMAIISITQLGTACKLCIGIYIASALCLVGALVLWRSAVNARGPAVGSAKESGSGAALLEVGVESAPASTNFLAGAFAVGVAFVAAPVALYLMLAPDHERFIGTCGGLAKQDDPYGVMVRMGRASPGAVPAIEILDPLCPACRAFETRLEDSGLRGRLDRRAVLFPLDNTCNWNVTEATHPGACTVSEAVLCAGDRADQVIAWAFATQEKIRDATKADPTAAAKMVKERFPELAACVGSPEAKSKLNKSLRWATTNSITVLTPQLFVAGVKLCDEDVDLGLDYMLGRMVERHGRGQLAVVPGEAPPLPPHIPPTPPAHTDTPPPVAKPTTKPTTETPTEPTTPTGGSDEPTEPTGGGSAEPTEPTGGSAGSAEPPPTEPSGGSAEPGPVTKPEPDPAAGSGAGGPP
jgi:uncharacterized membrane protein